MKNLIEEETRHEKCAFEAGLNCVCLPGFNRSSDDLCIDIDECSYKAFSCSESSVCKNNVGSYSCECPIGYGGENCTDINECSKGSHRCKKNLGQTCLNIVGSYDCTCDNGFTEVNNTCADINECSSTKHNCTSACANTYGSYYCKEHDFITFY